MDNIDNSDVNMEIKKIFDNNKVEDLKKFLSKRKSLNKCNVFYVYLFHIVQSAGIFVTTVATGYDIKYLVLIGLGLNILASIINICEKINNDMLKILLTDINNIKDDRYIDEQELVQIQNDKPIFNPNYPNLSYNNPHAYSNPHSNMFLPHIPTSKIVEESNLPNSLNSSSVKVPAEMPLTYTMPVRSHGKLEESVSSHGKFEKSESELDKKTSLSNPLPSVRNNLKGIFNKKTNKKTDEQIELINKSLINKSLNKDPTI